MRTVLAFFLVFLLTAVPTLAQDELPTCPEDNTPRLLRESAFDSELQIAIEENTEVEYRCYENGVEFTVGKYRGVDAVLFLSGVSMVNAAMNTQLAIDMFSETGIVYVGITGGVSPELNIGDVVVAGQWGQYQENTFVRETSPGEFSVDWDPEFPNYGMMFPGSVNVRSDDYPEGTSIFWFPVDSEMLTVAEEVAQNVDLADCTDEGVCLTHDPKVVVGGNGVSGPTFVDNAAYREYTYETFDALVLDMESAAAAHVAFSNGVPFIAFRSLSDLAGGGPGENEIGTFFQLAAANSERVVSAFMDAWALRNN